MSSDLYGGILTLQPAEIYGPPTGGNALGGPLAGGDIEDGGKYCVQGTVGIDSTPDIMVHRKVRLFCTRTGRLVREQWSDPVTGAYLFEHVRIGPWTIMSHDYTGNYNAVVADNVLGTAE